MVITFSSSQTTVYIGMDMIVNVPRARSRTSRRSGRQKRFEHIIGWSIIRPDMEKVEPAFVTCNTGHCATTSATAEYDAMMLRIGFSRCCKHITEEEIESAISHVRIKH